MFDPDKNRHNNESENVMNQTAQLKPPKISLLIAGNASAEVQRQAQYVTTSNEEEGFANAVERFILGSNNSERVADQSSKQSAVNGQF